VSVRVYVEGGGNYKHTDTATSCRRGFGGLFAKLPLPERSVSIVACGGRSDTFKDFRTAVGQGGRHFVALLVDSEGPVATSTSGWAHLKANDNWDRPTAATDDQAYLMVQCMEAWFLADREALRQFYGQGFIVESLPRGADVEQLPKDAIVSALKHASRRTSKGEYHKTRHGFALLLLIDVQKLRARSGHARRLFDTLIGRATRQAPDRIRNSRRNRRR
jgi:hypothetical protein